ncbi:Transcriptional regulator, LysR family [hydrothermal vent metagenome]|uniref:Transcriptional regulator, LysR family n=1 Tax=hydrothermal vent metagenome TaxID=652676 RepID=A0A3B0UJC1_9ZZZZ
MRYVQLRAFHNVAVHGGFSRAAAALFLTQPAISDQVKKLELEYDILLFNRHQKQLTLTRQGQKLLKITNRLFETERQAAELLSEARAIGVGKLTIIADSIMHIVDILSGFRKRYPNVEIEVHSGNSQEIVEKLRAYQADIGVLGEVPASGKFKAIKLSSTRLLAYVSRGHELSACGGMTLEKILQYPLVLREKGSKTRQIFEDIAARRSLYVRPAIVAQGRGAVGEIVAEGAGVGIISAAEFGGNSRLVAFEISDCNIEMDEALICLKERKASKLINAFMSLAKKQTAK